MQTAFHVHSPTCGCSPAARAAGETDNRPRVVIVGAGFGGLSAAKALAHAPVRVTLVDRRNHHLFQPLLYQVATAGLSPSQIATPIRSVLRSQKNAEVLLGEVQRVDVDQRQVFVEGRAINYDQLVIATGARHSYFGHDDWEAFAPGLKTLEDATELRKRILLAFERAELATNEDERHDLLTFIVIGAGPTGVEMAGAIAELARRALASDFRAIDPKSARVLLIEAGSRVLPSFPEPLSDYSAKKLEQLGVEVKLNAKVTGVTKTYVEVCDTQVRSSCVIWAAGVASSPVAKWLAAEADRAGRVLVGSDLTLPGRPEIFVIGDCASVNGPAGKPLPGLAPVAKQQGEYVGWLIEQRRRGRETKPFRYRDYGSLATIGRKVAIADFGRLHMRGFIGWLFWSLLHVYFLIGFRNRLSVAVDWAWSYFTFGRGSRLITGPIGQLEGRREDGAGAGRKAA